MTVFTSLIEPGGLVISCQAPAGHPLRDSTVMALMARAGELGGVAAVRANGNDDIRAIRATVSLPLIGIKKAGAPDEVFITPSVADALEVIKAGAAIVALDGTRRPRPDGIALADQIAAIKDEADVAVMADVDDLEAGLAARRAGADAIATTLSGYTLAGKLNGPGPGPGPDVELVARLSAALDCPVISEGRIRDEADVEAVRAAGAYAVVVGAALTDPLATTARLVRRLKIGTPS